MPIHPAQLTGTSLGRLVFEPNSEFDVEHISSTSYTVEPRVEISPLQHSEDAVSAVVTVHATVVFTRLDETDAPLPFELELDVHGVFRWSAETFPADEKLAIGWLQYNGMYLLWPYVRSHITTVTALSWLPPLIIGTMNVPTPPVISAGDEPASDGDETDDTIASEVSDSPAAP